jgi:hypothetical protein
MFDPNSQDSIRKLRKACKNSRKEMEASRKNYVKYLKELAGPHYSTSGDVVKRPINLVELAATIYKQNLLASSPQVNITARNPEYIADAYSFERAINHLLDTQNLEDELDLVVTNAMFAPVGVLKLSLDASQQADIDGTQVVTGPPVVQAVMFDDWVMDMTAKSPRQANFMGNRYTMTVEDAINMGYDPEAVARLWRTYEDSPRADDDPQRLSRKGRDITEENYQDLIELWDIWMPREKLVITLGGGGDGDFVDLEPLRVMPWQGPERGPFHMLWFEVVPGNALPNTPVGLWIDLHELVNTLWNKLADQAERQKSGIAAESSNSQDADTVKGMGDGDVIILNSLGNVAKIEHGGPNQQNAIFADMARMRFNEQAGNIYAMGGLSSQTATLGQDKLLSDAASQRLQRMQARVYTFMQRVMEDYAEHVAGDPLMEVPIVKQVPETDITVPGTWSQDQMRGDLTHYVLEIKPHSMQQKSPEERLARVQDVWRNDIPLMLPIMQAMGQMPNPEAYLKMIADLTGQPEINTLVTYTQGEMMAKQDGPSAPPNTTRTYERTSKPAPPDPGQAMAQQMAASGRDNQNQSGLIRGS